jgi:hypothetical protein
MPFHREAKYQLDLAKPQISKHLVRLLQYLASMPTKSEALNTILHQSFSQRPPKRNADIPEEWRYLPVHP